MRLVYVLLVPPARAPVPKPSTRLLEDTFWALARPEDRLEHLTVRDGPRPGTVAMVVFVRCRDGAQAAPAARGLCERVTRTASILTGWTVARCETVDPSL